MSALEAKDGAAHVWTHGKDSTMADRTPAESSVQRVYLPPLVGWQVSGGCSARVSCSDKPDGDVERAVGQGQRAACDMCYGVSKLGPSLQVSTSGFVLPRQHTEGVGGGFGFPLRDLRLPNTTVCQVLGLESWAQVGNSLCCI